MQNKMAAEESKQECYKVITGTFFPYSWPEQLPNGEIKVRGIVADVLDILVQKYEKCYEVKEVDETWLEIYPNGTWGGILGRIRYNKMDIMGAVMGLTTERLNEVATSRDIFIDHWSFVFRKPVDGPRVDGFLKPLNLTVWMMLLCFLIGLAFINVSILRKSSKYSRKDQKENSANGGGTPKASVSSSLLETLAILLGQDISIREKVVPYSGCLFVTWIFASLFVSMAYKTNLMAMLILPNLKYPFTDMAGFLAQNEMKAIIHESSVFYQTLKSFDKTTPEGQLFSKFIPVKGVNAGRVFFNSGNYAVFGSRALLLKEVEYAFRETRSCPYFITEPQYSAILRMAFSKKFPLIDQFRNGMTRLNEFGIIKHITNNHAKNMYCSSGESNSVSNRILVLKDFNGIFMLLGAGLGLSCSVFLGELLWRPNNEVKTLNTSE